MLRESHILVACFVLLQRNASLHSGVRVISGQCNKLLQIQHSYNFDEILQFLVENTTQNNNEPCAQSPV